MRVKTVLMLSAVASIVFIASVTFAFPSIDDLFVENPFWNGLSKLYSRLNIVRLVSLESLNTEVDEPKSSSLLLIGPSKLFSEREKADILVFISNGGTLVLADDFGTGNELLRGLNIPIQFDMLLLQDRLVNERNSLMPKIRVTGSGWFEGVEHLVFNYPSTLSVTGTSKILAWSSTFSYRAWEPVDPSDSLRAGPFPVIAEFKLGNGRLIAVSDSSLFINSMIDRGGNWEFLENLATGKVYIDEGHSTPSRLTNVKNYILSVYTVFGNAEIRYGSTLLLVTLIYKLNWANPKDPQPDEVEQVLRKHPEYNRDMVEKLYEERRLARGLN
jgi:hypothetical protein